jgi:hypothetical protein
MKPLYRHAVPFSEGLTNVKPAAEETSCSGFIDHNGKYIISPAFYYGADFGTVSASSKPEAKLDISINTALLYGADPSWKSVLPPALASRIR